MAPIIETSAVWPWCSRSFQDICRGLWIIIAELTCGLFSMIFRMVRPSWIPSTPDDAPAVAIFHDMAALVARTVMGERWLPTSTVSSTKLDTELTVYQIGNFSSLAWSNIFKFTLQVW
jgi:hypothetical protein